MLMQISDTIIVLRGCNYYTYIAAVVNGEPKTISAGDDRTLAPGVLQTVDSYSESKDAFGNKSK